MDNKKLIYFIFSIILLSLPLYADEEPDKSNDKNILDFEGDVIEGKKAKPDIFLQLDSGTSSLDSLIYSRENFNDFQKLESRRLSIWKLDK